MITNYKELRNDALEMESFLIQAYAQRAIFEKRKVELASICRKKDEKTKNPLIINLQENSEQELRNVKGKADEFETELKKKVRDFLDSVKQFINLEYSNYADYYKKEGEKNIVIEQNLRRLYEIEKSIPDIKITMDIVENDPGEIYEVFVYNIKDLTTSESANKKAEKIYYDALKYLSEVGVKDRNIYVYTDMLSEHFNIKDKDIVVALKNMLIESKALRSNGTINIFNVGNFLCKPKDTNTPTTNNSTEPVIQKNKREPELMPFFGEDYSH